MALTPDTLGCVFNMSVWNADFTMANDLSTSETNLDLSYNAIVWVNLPDAFTTAFTFTVTNGVSPNSTSNTLYEIDVAGCDASQNFLPYALGTVKLHSAGCDAQISTNFPTQTTITGATAPLLSLATQGSLSLATTYTNGIGYADMSLNSSIAADYLGYLGYSCFGDTNAGNFFTQTSIVTFAGEMPVFDKTFNDTQVMPMIQASVSDLDMESAGVEIDAQQQSLCYFLYKQLMENAPERFRVGSGSMSQPDSIVSPNKWYLPIQSGDVLECIITMNSSDAQAVFGSNVNLVQGTFHAIARKYLVRFIVGTGAAPADADSSDSTAIHNQNVGTRL